MNRFCCVALFAAASFVVACDPPAHTLELGQACENEDDCAAGLLCLTTQEIDPAADELQCIDGDKFCTNHCVDDADCASLGDGVICVREADLCDGSCFVGENG